MVSRRLSEAGHKFAIQSRGYRRKNKDELGDEPNMLRGNLNIPVIVGENRLKKARQAAEQLNLDTIILDDGFQHWKIFRDIDVVVIDAMNPFGNGCLIPRGILREPLCALKRASVFFLTHTDLAKDNLAKIKQRLNEVNPGVQIIESVHFPIGFYNILDNHKRIVSLDSSKDKKLCLVTAIGNPESFELMISRMGLKQALKFTFLDHHEFNQEDFKKIISKCLQEGISTIVTTEKDAVKLKDYCLGLSGFEVFVLKME
jgi:Tetraacyldisaccharide-1-P 4'-kinase